MHVKEQSTNAAINVYNTIRLSSSSSYEDEDAANVM